MQLSFVQVLQISLAAATLTLPAASEQYRRTVLTDGALKPTELRQQYAARSFVPVWLPAEPADVLGFIGTDYQRLRLKLLTVRPDPQQPGRYLVTGKSKVRTNVTSFTGTFRVLHVRENEDPPRTVDEGPTPAVKSGVVLAEYELRETAGQPGAGVFRGVRRSGWYQDRAGKLYYDNLQAYSDAFNNNQCVGTWQSYKTGAIKSCNWGDYRIPESGDFDQGAGEFSPAAKYLANGWESYSRAWLGNDKAAQQQERAAWWK